MAFVGGCLCGACRYEIDRKYLNAIHCYCGMCRKAHGTAFSTHVALRRDQFRWLEGEPQVVPYESSPAWPAPSMISRRRRSSKNDSKPSRQLGSIIPGRG